MSGVDEKEIAAPGLAAKASGRGTTEMRMRRKSVGEWDKWTLGVPGDSKGPDRRPPGSTGGHALPVSQDCVLQFRPGDVLPWISRIPRPPPSVPHVFSTKSET